MKVLGHDSYTSWLVTVSCGLIFCLNTVPYRIAGLIFVLTTEYYDADRETASIPILLLLLMSCLGGPVSGVLGVKFGAENLTIVGGLLTAVGFGTCFYSQTVIGVSLLLGIVSGIGVSFSTAMVPNIIKKYFTKNFTTANGIAHAGLCIGSLIIPPSATYLIGLYGVSGAFLIFSGIMLNAVPVAIYVQRSGRIQDIIIRCQTHVNKGFEDEETKSETELPIKSNVPSVTETSSENVLNLEKSPSVSLTVAFKYKKNSGNTEYCSNKYEQNSKAEDGLMDENMLCLPKTPTEETKRLKNTNQTVQNNFRNEKKLLHAFRVYKDIPFLFILLNIGLATYVTSLFWTTMIDYSRDKGIPRNLEIYFLMFQPLVDLVGRTCFGWITDLGYVTLSSFGMLCYGQMALAIFVVMWTSRFGVMMAGACWYSLNAGAMTTVYPGIIFKCIHKDNQTMAVASRYSFYGVLVFTSSPLIGYFRENLGSYDGLYCVFIALCLVCAAVMPLIFKFTQQNEHLQINSH